MPVVRGLCRAYDAPAEARHELIRLAAAAQDGSVDAAEVRKRGGWQMQDRVAVAEEAAAEIRCWHCASICGDCQTRAYATALFGEDYLPPQDVKKTVDHRLQRQQLLRSGRRFRIVHTEGALMWCMGSPAVMVEQLEKLLQIGQLPDVQVGLVPFGTPANVPPMHDYTVLDRSAVHFGTNHRTEFITNRRYVSRYLEHWDELQPLIVWGEPALEAIDRVRDRYSSL